MPGIQPYPKLQKVSFHGGSRADLGHVMSSRGLKLDKAKVDVIKSLPIPKTYEKYAYSLGM